MKYIYLSVITLLSLVANAQNEVRWMLSGALTPTSVAIRAKMTTNSNYVRALVSTSNPPAAPFIYSTVSDATESVNRRMASMDVTGLQPNTQYYYLIEADSIADNSADDIGTFKTSAIGPQSFSFVVGSCNREPNTNTYKDFLNYNALFYLNLGDLHYEDPCDADINYHRDAYEQNVFTRANQAEVFRKLPFAYIWDDHDYCGNDANGNAFPGTGPARNAYQEYIPHYALAAGTGNQPIYQSFDVGRVRFILSDLRSEKVEQQTAMGAVQKQWFKNQLVDARNKNMMVAWASSYSWYGILTDNWNGNPQERTELSEFMRDSSIANLFIMNGDAHMFAIDNGTNGDFTTAKNLPYQYPLVQAGPIQNDGSYKGGTYSEGTFYQFFVKAAQYGVVKVTDNGGDSVCVTIEGYKKDIATQTTTLLKSWSFCRKLGNYISSVPNAAMDVSSVEVFPNPANGNFYIRSHEKEIVKLTVTSIDGSVIFQSTMEPEYTQPLDLTKYAPGVYIAQIETSKGKYSKRLVYNQ